MGHSPNVTPSPRVQQPKSRSQGSNMPTVEEDIFGSWDEIEREEGQIRMELNAAAPGDPILGPIDQLPDEEFPDLPFQVFSTRFGGVYHLSRSCRHLASVGEHWSGERIKMVQSMPTLCLSKWISSCSWCHPVSESVRKCCTFRYEMPYSTGIESSATVHGMFRNQKFNSLSLAER